MWIKTQDGKRIINTDNIVGIGVSRRIYANGTVDIYASIANGSTDVILGTYPIGEVADKFNAICSELTHIMDLSAE